MQLANRHLVVGLSPAPRCGLAALVDRQTGRSFLHPSSAPLYRLQLVRRGEEPRWVTSFDAREVTGRERSGGRGLELSFRGHADVDLDVTCTVELADDDPLSRWRIAIANRGAWGVRTVEYPVIVAPAALGGTDADDRFIWGLYGGQLIRRPAFQLRRQELERQVPLLLDEGEEPAQYDTAGPPQYPGILAVQMQAYYDPVAGLYQATHDAAGTVKTFGCRLAEAGQALDLSIRHHYREAPGVDVALPYDTVVGVFHGDWYDAADLYAAWARRQHWCSRTLRERTDLPAWILEPRPTLMCIQQGSRERTKGALFSPPSELPIGQYWPTRKLVPLVRKFAAALGGPVVAWIEDWEREGCPAGPVDIFPPLEGEESFRAATRRIGDDGNAVLLFLSGLNWCIQRPTTGYDGRERFEREGRALAALDEHGQVERVVFPNVLKRFAPLCTGAPGLRELYTRNAAALVDLGAVAVQLDQQTGLGLTRCWSDRHGHEPGYGPWMYESMRDFVAAFRATLKARNPQAAFSYESVGELWLQQTDSHLYRPFMVYLGFVPLFSYLFHDYALSFGGDTMMGPAHPEVSTMKQALCCAYGQQNLISVAEDDYNIELEEYPHPAIDMLASISRAQRGFAREYLVFGRMRRPAPLEVRRITVEEWAPIGQRILRTESLPVVFHSSWTAPGGTVGHVLVNWTGQAEEVSLDVGTGTSRLSVTDGQGCRSAAATGGRLALTVPPRSVMLVEATAAAGA